MNIFSEAGNRLSETRDGVADTYSYVPNAAGGNSAQLQQIQFGAATRRSSNRSNSVLLWCQPPKNGSHPKMAAIPEINLLESPCSNQEAFAILRSTDSMSRWWLFSGGMQSEERDVFPAPEL